jgi:hypothetical protein
MSGSQLTMKTRRWIIIAAGIALLLILGIILSLALGTRQPDTSPKLALLEYGKPVKMTLAWSNRIYLVTSTSVPSDKIGNRIGEVKRTVSPKPILNGDLARNTPEGPSYLLQGGGAIYKIKNSSSKNKIALERESGRYCLCEYYCSLSGSLSLPIFILNWCGEKDFCFRNWLIK